MLQLNSCPRTIQWRSLSGRRHLIRFTKLSQPLSKTKEFALRSIKNPARRSRPTCFQRTTAWSTCSPMWERTIACSAGCPFAAWHRGWGSQFRPSILITRTGSWELRRQLQSIFSRVDEPGDTQLAAAKVTDLSAKMTPIVIANVGGATPTVESVMIPPRRSFSGDITMPMF